MSITQDALYAATWGTVGSILRGLWFLKDKVTDRQYRNSFRIYFLTVPFLGALFGAILYFILLTGFLFVGGSQLPSVLDQPALPADSTGSNSTPTTSTGVITSKLAIILLATLAGFNWGWAIMIFKRIGDSFKEIPEQDSKLGK